MPRGYFLRRKEKPNAKSSGAQEPCRIQDSASLRRGQRDNLSYQSLGRPLNFSEVIERRRPVEVSDPGRFAIELANLGVSVRLTMSWQGREYWVLVRQQRPDRGDVVLKLISGYIPAHELNLPLLTAIQEIAEECLLETPEGWLAGRFRRYVAAHSVPGQPALPRGGALLASQSGATRPVQCGNMVLMERPRAYVHLPTASLQLVYDMRMELPKEARQLSLFHVDERLEDGQLVARLERSRPTLPDTAEAGPAAGSAAATAWPVQPGEHSRPMAIGKLCAAGWWCATSAFAGGLVGRQAGRRGAEPLGPASERTGPCSRNRTCRAIAGMAPPTNRLHTLEISTKIPI